MKKAITFVLAIVLTVSYLPTIDKAVKADELTVNAKVYFVSQATGKLITLDGVVDNPINCTTIYNGEDSVPDNGKFTIYYGNGTTDASRNKTVVNFTCDGTNTSWKADNDKVFQMGKRTNPSGWESVMMEAQGDGTVAFRSCANSKYFSLKGEELGLVDIKTDEGEEVSNNEKFIPYTDTKPKTATGLQAGEVSGNSIEVKWTGVDKCIYTGYEVLYSTSEDGEYESAGTTGDTSLEIKGLTLSTTYYVKVRTLTRIGGVFAESDPITITTLDDYKPEKVENISVEKTEDGMKVEWDASQGSTMYTVYRSDSRFGEYEELDTVNTNTFVDTNPNESKYKNYYKIRGKNSADIGPFSDPASIEINMFGKNMYIFSDTDDRSEIDKVIDSTYKKQHYNQFGTDRYSFAFKPGDYTNTETINIGYYTQILGLGKTPTETRLRNVKVPAALSDNNATCNFWVGLENATIADTDNNGDDYFAFQWAASQAAPARRLDVERRAVFDWWSGWASGGFVADTRFQKQCGSWSQQQYYYRNCQMEANVFGVNWNQVIQGCDGNPLNTSGYSDLKKGNGKSNWNKRGNNTLVSKTPVDREKPFLYFDESSDSYKVFVPRIRTNSSSISWSDTGMGRGTSISVDDCFYIANPDRDNADTINEQLDKGMNIIFQPGRYHVDKPLQVTKSNTILLGLGLATIIPDNEEAAIKVADVGGVSLAGLLIDAGSHSEKMVQIGEEGCNKDHSENPILLHDIIYRVGGTKKLGTCDTCLEINSNNTIIDHTWIWRADHGDNTGWTVNKSKNGLIVNGDNVTAYGLFCEHFQEYDILWRGEKGRTYFLQNEKCYDPQNQEGWMSHDGEKKGYAAYKVTDNVEEHYAVGLGVYDVFINTNGASVFLDNAIEVPNKPNVLIENATIVEIANGSGPKVGINHIVNNTTAGIRTGAGYGSDGGYALQKLLSYCNEESISLSDYYENKNVANIVEEEGETPTIDEKAEKDIVKEPSSKDDETPIWDMTTQDYINRIKESETTTEAPTEAPTETTTETPTAEPTDKPTEETTEKQTEKPTEKPTEKETSNVDPKKNINGGETNSVNIVGQKFVSGKYIYKVTGAAKKVGAATLIGVVKKYQKKLKKVNVVASIKYRGYTLMVNKVGAKAFKKCKKVKSITLGKRVGTIKAKAFGDCPKVKKVTVKGTALKKVAKNAFNKKVRKSIKIKAKKKPKKVILKSLKRKK